MIEIKERNDIQSELRYPVDIKKYIEEIKIFLDVSGVFENKESESNDALRYLDEMKEYLSSIKKIVLEEGIEKEEKYLNDLAKKIPKNKVITRENLLDLKVFIQSECSGDDLPALTNWVDLVLLENKSFTVDGLLQFIKLMEKKKREQKKVQVMQDFLNDTEKLIKFDKILGNLPYKYKDKLEPFFFIPKQIQKEFKHIHFEDLGCSELNLKGSVEDFKNSVQNNKEIVEEMICNRLVPRMDSSLVSLSKYMSGGYEMVIDSKTRQGFPILNKVMGRYRDEKKIHKLLKEVLSPVLVAKNGDKESLTLDWEAFFIKSKNYVYIQDEKEKKNMKHSVFLVMMREFDKAYSFEEFLKSEDLIPLWNDLAEDLLKNFPKGIQMHDSEIINVLSMFWKKDGKGDKQKIPTKVFELIKKWKEAKKQKKKEAEEVNKTIKNTKTNLEEIVYDRNYVSQNTVRYKKTVKKVEEKEITVFDVPNIREENGGYWVSNVPAGASVFIKLGQGNKKSKELSVLPDGKINFGICPLKPFTKYKIYFAQQGEIVDMDSHPFLDPRVQFTEIQTPAAPISETQEILKSTKKEVADSVETIVSNPENIVPKKTKNDFDEYLAIFLSEMKDSLSVNFDGKSKFTLSLKSLLASNDFKEFFSEFSDENIKEWMQMVDVFVFTVSNSKGIHIEPATKGDLKETLELIVLDFIKFKWGSVEKMRDTQSEDEVIKWRAENQNLFDEFSESAVLFRRFSNYWKDSRGQTFWDAQRLGKCDFEGKEKKGLPNFESHGIKYSISPYLTKRIDPINFCVEVPGKNEDEKRRFSASVKFLDDQNDFEVTLQNPSEVPNAWEQIIKRVGKGIFTSIIAKTAKEYGFAPLKEEEERLRSSSELQESAWKKMLKGNVRTAEYSEDGFLMDIKEQNFSSFEDAIAFIKSYGEILLKQPFVRFTGDKNGENGGVKNGSKNGKAGNVEFLRGMLTHPQNQKYLMERILATAQEIFTEKKSLDATSIRDLKVREIIKQNFQNLDITATPDAIGGLLSEKIQGKPALDFFVDSLEKGEVSFEPINENTYRTYDLIQLAKIKRWEKSESL